MSNSKPPKEVPGWFWGLLGVVVFIWFAYWCGRGK